MGKDFFLSRGPQIGFLGSFWLGVNWPRSGPTQLHSAPCLSLSSPGTPGPGGAQEVLVGDGDPGRFVLLLGTQGEQQSLCWPPLHTAPQEQFLSTREKPIIIFKALRCHHFFGGGTKCT